jgi:hypothetical protein
VVIVSVNGTEDRRIDSRQRVCMVIMDLKNCM